MVSIRRLINLDGRSTVRQLGQILSLSGHVSLRNISDIIASGISDASAEDTFLFQNLGLFPDRIKFEIAGIDIKDVKLYEGHERHLVLASLSQYLRDNRPSVAAFCEFWVPEERESFCNAISDVYPYRATGEGKLTRTIATTLWGLVNFPIEMPIDSGLLILSQYPIEQSHVLVFPACCGEDCFTPKGAVHARINLGYMAPDVFVTHLQSCPPKIAVYPPPVSCEDTQSRQVSALSAFINKYRRSMRPTIIMGDFNINGVDTAGSAYQELVRVLGYPRDLAVEAEEGKAAPRGARADFNLVTKESLSTFSLDQAGSVEEDERQKDPQGARWDYIFCHPSSRSLGRVFPLFSSFERVRLRTSPYRDLSDHLGLLARQKALIPSTPEWAQTITTMKLTLSEYVSPPLASASTPKAPDPEDLHLRVSCDMGEKIETPWYEVWKRMDKEAAHYYFFDENSTLTVPDPGGGVNFKVECYIGGARVEDNHGTFVGYRDPWFTGKGAVEISRKQLLDAKMLGDYSLETRITFRAKEFGDQDLATHTVKWELYAE